MVITLRMRQQPITNLNLTITPSTSSNMALKIATLVTSRSSTRAATETRSRALTAWWSPTAPVVWSTTPPTTRTGSTPSSPRRDTPPTPHPSPIMATTSNLANPQQSSCTISNCQQLPININYP